jgi:hypothetical protein
MVIARTSRPQRARTVIGPRTSPLRAGQHDERRARRQLADGIGPDLGDGGAVPVDRHVGDAIASWPSSTDA